MKNFNQNIVNFITILVKEYKTVKKDKNIKNNILRGRAVSLSGFVENQFALLIEAELGDNYNLYVDFPITISYRNKRSKVFYPDIIILRNKTIIGIIELKIDIGYTKQEYINDFQDKIKIIKNRNKVNINKGADTLLVNKQFISQIIVISSENAHGKFSKNDITDEVIILINNNLHPNDDKIDDESNYLKSIKNDLVNIDMWNKLALFLDRVKKIT